MEYVLGEEGRAIFKQISGHVLILIVMEYVLGEHRDAKEWACFNSLNPYCNGICSRSRASIPTIDIVEEPVLILIVMEYVLGVLQYKQARYRAQSLNPYCNGICSRREVRKRRHYPSTGCLNPYCNGICSRSTPQWVWRAIAEPS